MKSHRLAAAILIVSSLAVFSPQPAAARMNLILNRPAHQMDAQHRSWAVDDNKNGGWFDGG